MLKEIATIGLWDSGSDNEGFLFIFLRPGDSIVIALTIPKGSLLTELHPEVFTEGNEVLGLLRNNPGWWGSR